MIGSRAGLMTFKSASFAEFYPEHFDKVLRFFEVLTKQRRIEINIF